MAADLGTAGSNAVVQRTAEIGHERTAVTQKTMKRSAAKRRYQKPIHKVF
jgi:hypothetical protein